MAWLSRLLYRDGGGRIAAGDEVGRRGRGGGHVGGRFTAVNCAAGDGKPASDRVAVNVEGQGAMHGDR